MAFAYRDDLGMYQIEDGRYAIYWLFYSGREDAWLRRDIFVSVSLTTTMKRLNSTVLTI